MPIAMKMPSPNHWTVAREFLVGAFTQNQGDGVTCWRNSSPPISDVWSVLFAGCLRHVAMCLACRRAEPSVGSTALAPLFFPLRLFLCCASCFLPSHLVVETQIVSLQPVCILDLAEFRPAGIIHASCSPLRVLKARQVALSLGQTEV